MEHTEYHQLCLWDPEDRILREDFNSDNAKTEAALADLTEAVAGCGNCKIEYGSYAGSGNYSSAHPNSLTFSGQPLLVLIQDRSPVNFLHLVYGCTNSKITGADTADAENVTVNWSTANTVKWYSKNVTSQANAVNHTYYYVALLAADE